MFGRKFGLHKFVKWTSYSTLEYIAYHCPCVLCVCNFVSLSLLLCIHAFLKMHVWDGIIVVRLRCWVVLDCIFLSSLLQSDGDMDLLDVFCGTLAFQIVTSWRKRVSSCLESTEWSSRWWTTWRKLQCILLAAGSLWANMVDPVSYTHLTLPTNREV